jgi:hypothetical protein
MAKVRYYVNPSSLGSYFGVGFNSFEDQLEIDLGNTDNDFDDDAKDRMSLGRHLEDAALNYFEEKLGVLITNRNTGVTPIYGGKMLGKVDGETILDGKKTVVEMKISNSKSYKFTDSLGYIIQVQSYMIDNDYEQGLLCGLWQGKPIYKIIPKDEEMIKDIKEMVDYVTGILLGVYTVDEIPAELLTKYSGDKVVESIEHVSEGTKNYWLELGKLNAEKSKVEKAIKDLKAAHENDLDVQEGKYEDDFLKVSVSDVIQKGKIDLDRLSLDHPEIDMEKYREEPSSYQRVTIKIK